MVKYAWCHLLLFECLLGMEMMSAFYHKQSSSSPSRPAFAVLAMSSTPPLPNPSLSHLHAKSFLKDILSSRTNVNRKKELLRELQGLRAMNSSYTSFLDSILIEVDQIKSNSIAMMKFPIPLPSYRMKLGSLARVLSQVESEADVDEKASFTTVQSSRRRALSIVLNQLPDVRSIRALEAEANRRKKNVSSMEEMLQRTPKDLETPSYTVLSPSFKTWEVRQYDDFAVCSTMMNVNEPGPGAFNALAGYIFGKNSVQEKMAMTTPVLSTTDPSSSRRKMSFVMPSRFWKDKNFASAPKPIDASVSVEGLGGGLVADSSTIAVKWFGGFASAAEVSRQSAALIAGLQSEGQSDWEMVNPNASPFLMQYNDPFQPPWKRRNEVAVPVRRRKQP